MKKFLSIIFFSLLALNVAYADDSYEAAFKKALDNHQYYFKHKGKSYTTDTKDKPFDFFDHGYNYHEASLYMQKNYVDPSDGNFGCMLYNGYLYQFQNSDQKKHNYLDYDKEGWKQKTIAKSEDNLVTVILIEAPTCMELSNYFKIYLNGKEVFNSREEANYEPWMVGFNINLYIDKDYNQNGKKELFIDAGISQGNNWSEQYYFFEYDKNSIKLVKNFWAVDWKERLGVSHLLKANFEATEEALLAKIINRNFSENVYVECIEGDCINGNGTFDSRFGDKYVGEFKDGKYHGQGTETDANGDKYVGEFKNGLKNGQGTLIFRNGKPDGQGQGTYIYTDGNKYVGEFKNGDMQGQGTLIYADGEKFVGEFEYGRPHGQGTLTYADGEIEKGIFKNGKLNK